jgi:hypothetical protein
MTAGDVSIQYLAQVHRSTCFRRLAWHRIPPSRSAARGLTAACHPCCVAASRTPSGQLSGMQPVSSNQPTDSQDRSKGRDTSGPRCARGTAPRRAEVLQRGPWMREGLQEQAPLGRAVQTARRAPQPGRARPPPAAEVCDRVEGALFHAGWQELGLPVPPACAMGVQGGQVGEPSPDCWHTGAVCGQMSRPHRRTDTRMDEETDRHSTNTS